jgi:hypothetical protein
VSARLRLVVALAALVVLAAHLRSLPRTLEDIDSINFALGVESFDVAAHRPHPPGYPLYIALAKATTAAANAMAPSWDRDRRAAVGLAVWSAISAALAVPALTLFWLALGIRERDAFFAAMLAVASPLFWFSASRPLSDVPGLVAAIGVQVLLARALLRGLAGGASGVTVWAAGAAGFVIGLRSQTMWINGPLLAWLVIVLATRGRMRAAIHAVVAAAVGGLAWFVPLILDTGGVQGFLRALGSQGAQDFGGIEMLATTPTAQVFAAAAENTFVHPWFAENLAYAALLAAIAGAVVWMLRARRPLAILLVSFVPYLIFHLAFHETATLRYALPVVVPVAGLAVVGLALLGRHAATASTAAIAAAGLFLAQPVLVTYASEGAPIHRAFQDMIAARGAIAEVPVLQMHHQVWHGVRRPIDWFKPQWDVGSQPFPGDREFRALIAHWRQGGTQPVWFLSHLPRTDLFLFDPRSWTVRGRYTPDPRVLRLMGDDTRLDAVGWVDLRPPRWMLADGWALTTEITGMTEADKAWPHVRPAVGYLRRDRSPLLMKIGGRHHGPAGADAVRVALHVDGAPVGEWRVTPEEPWMIDWVELPQGVPDGAGPYAEMTVAVRPDGGGTVAPSFGLEQFDVAAPGEPIVAFLADWNEFEGDPGGRLWRWSTNRSTVEIRNQAGDVTLTLEGESPLKYFDRAPTVVVRAGTVEVARFQPAADFVQRITLADRDLRAAGGRVTIETDLVWVPAEREPSPDRRRLGLRLFRVDVR